MEATAYYPGSVGEIVQGNMRGLDVLASCPINLYTKVRVFEDSCAYRQHGNYKTNKFMINILKAWGYEEFGKILKINVNSHIPIGKGFASSTADLCALYNALLKLFNRKFSERELVKECLRIEPTDSIIFEKMTLFDYKRGTFKKTIGNYMEFYVVIFEGRNKINTIEFNKKTLPAHGDISDLIPILIEGVRERNLEKLAFCSTESIIRNQHRLKYDFLDKVLYIMKDIGGIGILGAHSGNCLGIILDDLEKLKYYRNHSNRRELNEYSTYLVKAIKNIDRTLLPLF
ncbi:kinase involved in propanediol utilization [Clostridium pasteurianum]|uniref:Putative kinase involved in propanediol utilization n=1 Tax=Clostridium pasteurianum BC1 TaxID=86416 RepID=R4K995_CLOPA|nr:kinase involved in propanediol utilization [Clostridium pasteurianum]AGK96215.1 putative kinase involved in propanediol utilization [Clostridium pasteurianum BC1]